MPHSTVRISPAANHLLSELAQHTGQTKTDIVASALESYRRKLFFEKLNAAYAELRKDAAAWADELEQRRQFDATLLDGLDPDELWSESTRRPKRTKKKR